MAKEGLTMSMLYGNQQASTYLWTQKFHFSNNRLNYEINSSLTLQKLDKWQKCIDSGQPARTAQADLSR